MKKNIFIILLLIFETISAFSQTGIVITNKVVDEKSKEPLVFAHIFIKTLSTGTFTDENGYFTLTIPKSSINEILTISFIGYETLNLRVSEMKNNTISLTPEVNMIEEIAIVASYNPKKIKLCTLLYKFENRKVNFEPDYYGFKIPNYFVIGYGLDYDENYRHLPFIGYFE